MDKQPDLSIIVPNHRELKVGEVRTLLTQYFPKAEVFISNDYYGRGKGWAIRKGVEQTKGRLVCFLDGDMDIHPAELFKLLDKIEDYDIVIGNRSYKASVIRKVLNIGYSLMLKVLFGIPYHMDTQSGIKLFHRKVLPKWETDSFAYDVEILAKVAKGEYSIAQVTVVSEIHKAKSIKAVWTTFVETIKVRYRL